MNLLKVGFLPLFILLLLSACSDDDEMTASQDPLIGMWEGVITQPDYGSHDASITISSLIASNSSGNVSYASKDLSICNEAIFICEPINCSGTWIYTGKTGSTYTFSEEFATGTDCANGTVEISFNGSDKINYTWTEDFSDPFTASGTLERKK